MKHINLQFSCSVLCGNIESDLQKKTQDRVRHLAFSFCDRKLCGAFWVRKASKMFAFPQSKTCKSQLIIYNVAVLSSI